MAAIDARRGRNMILAPREQDQAQTVLETVGPVFGSVVVTSPDGRDLTLPDELVATLNSVIGAIAAGSRFAITSLPEELTTTVAAGQLGVSRPTLMKMINAGEIPAHKVGSHHRVKTVDVMTYKKNRIDRQRAAINELRDLERESSTLTRNPSVESTRQT